MAKLHRILQVAMGWEDYHLHQFVPEVKDESSTKLNEVAIQKGSEIGYLYDFGDGWEPEIVVTKILHRSGVKYPICIGGKRACPPEDCGGPWGYAEFLKAIRNPRHRDHRELREWVGGVFDPEAFKLESINKALKTIK